MWLPVNFWQISTAKRQLWQVPADSNSGSIPNSSLQAINPEFGEISLTEFDNFYIFQFGNVYRTGLIAFDSYLEPKRNCWLQEPVKYWRSTVKSVRFDVWLLKSIKNLHSTTLQVILKDFKCQMIILTTVNRLMSIFDSFQRSNVHFDRKFHCNISFLTNSLHKNAQNCLISKISFPRTRTETRTGRIQSWRYRMDPHWIL